VEQYPNVLHLIGSLEPGGTERQLVAFLDRCSDASRHRIIVFHKPGRLANEVATGWTLVGPISRRWGGIPSVARTVREIRRSIRDAPVDIVHAHLGISQLLAAAAVPREVPIIASRRGRTPPLEETVLGRALVSAADRRTRLVLCNSDELVQRARAQRSSPPVELVRNGVDLSRFAPLPMPQGPPTVVVVARMRPEKGHDLFLRAFRLVRDRLPIARAVLVGDGPSFDEVRSLASALGLDPAVTFVGGVEDPRSHLAEAHVVALSSPHEGFPNALLEAMACGRPVVATAVGGVPELVEDGVHGRLTSTRVDAFADALFDVLRDPGAGEAMGLAARTRACDFEWGSVVERMERIYRSVADRGAVATTVEVV
jgi:glycosyltransferase involved in cell wall biosynthesis